MTKYNPILEDEMYWRYQDLVESWIDFLKETFDIEVSRQDLREITSLLARESYDRGYDDACAAIDMAYKNEEEILN